MWDYVILEIYGAICIIWIVYVSLSVFKWLRITTGEFVKFGLFGSLCVIMWLWEKRRFCVILMDYVVLSDNLVKLA